MIRIIHVKGGIWFCPPNSDKKKPERETKCQETITTGAHQGFEGSNAATTDHFAVLHSPTTVTTRLAARLDTVSPIGEEMIVQTSGTVGQSCSYILRLLLQWGIHWSATISIYWYFHLIKDFMSFWNLSNIQYIFSSSAIAKKNTVSNQIATCRTPKIPKGTSFSSFLSVNSCPDVVDPNGASLMLGFSLRRFLTLGGGLNCLDSRLYKRCCTVYYGIYIPTFTIQTNQM